MITPRDKLEPRGDNEPKFNPNNKVDRKIVTILGVSMGVLILLAVACFLIYYFVFYNG